MEADTVQTLSGVKEIVVTLAAATGAIVAVIGLKTWQREMRGKTEYELARRCLRDVYRVRDALKWVRNPMMGSAELEQARKEKNLPETTSLDMDAMNRISIAAYDVRWNNVIDAYSDLTADLREAEVLWPDVQDDAGSLRDCVARLRVNLRWHFRGQERRLQISAEKQKEIDETVFEVDEHDKYNTALDAAVKKLEAVLVPHLRRIGRRASKWPNPFGGGRTPAA